MIPKSGYRFSDKIMLKSSVELGDDLHMRRIAELVDWRDGNQPIAAADQNACVARERRGIARHGDLARLRLRALARRIEHHRVEGFQFIRRERTAKEVARFGFDRFQARRL